MKIKKLYTKWLYKKGFCPYNDTAPKHYKLLTYWLFSPSVWAIEVGKDIAIGL